MEKIFAAIEEKLKSLENDIFVKDLRIEALEKELEEAEQEIKMLKGEFPNEL